MSHRPIGIVGTDGVARMAAERIAAAGQRVLLYVTGDQQATARAAKLPKYIERAATPTDIGFDCEAVLSFIDDSLAFRDFLIGTADRTGLGAEMNPGAVIADFGVRPPRETQALLGVTGMRGVAIIDAAIIGTGAAIESGTATILVGGYPDAIDTVEPALKLLGKTERTGPLGSAHTAAALMGYIETAHHIAHEHAASVGRALGLNSETMARVLNTDARTATAGNIVSLARRTGLALRLATDRGVSADVIDFSGARPAETAEAKR